MTNKKFKRVGLIGRFKPLHLGGAVMLECVCENAEHVVIGIGSSNKYNVRNPFKAHETKDMINAFLSTRFSNYEIIYVPDSGHIPEFKDGQKWRKYVLEYFGKLDCFISGNDYVRELLKNGAHPNLRDKRGRTALDAAQKNRHIEIASLLEQGEP